MTDWIDAKFDELGLKKTPLRRFLLQRFAEAPYASSQRQLLEALSGHPELAKVDRVSVYRNLKQFVELGLLHEVSDNEYVYCQQEDSDHSHYLMYCKSCHRHEEISDKKRVQALQKALGHDSFLETSKEISLVGQCGSCS